jgi:hypothetical protein
LDELRERAALYGVIENLHPGSFQLGGHVTDRPSDVIYFSLVTLTTIGYGDIVDVARNSVES